MRFVRVEDIPEMRRERNHNDVCMLIENFLASDMEYAKVVLDPGDYANAEYARQSLLQARRYRNYNVNIIVRNGEMYLARKDS